MKTMDVTDAAPMQAEFEKIAYSSDVYPIEYVPNFVELEYMVPVEHGKDAVRELMLTKHTDCIYPIEYRFIAGDEGCISPYYKQDSISLSVSGGRAWITGPICATSTPSCGATIHARTGARCTFSTARTSARSIPAPPTSARCDANSIRRVAFSTNTSGCCWGERR
jgi:hypothetical protein